MREKCKNLVESPSLRDGCLRRPPQFRVASNPASGAVNHASSWNSWEVKNVQIPLFCLLLVPRRFALVHRRSPWLLTRLFTFWSACGFSSEGRLQHSLIGGWPREDVPLVPAKMVLRRF